MNPKLIIEIQAEQSHGREKYGRGPHDLAHDDETRELAWTGYIRRHLDYAEQALPLEYRQQLVKIAGLAASAIESFDRKRDAKQPK